MRAGETVSFFNISGTPAAFALRGGRYGVDVVGTWNSGSVTLERLGGDGSTYVAVLTAFSANGFATVDLPAGTYKLVIAAATGVSAVIVRIPGE